MDNICKLKFNNKTKMVSNNPNESKLLETFFDVFKTTKVGIIKLDNKEYLLKKEYFIKKFPLLINIYKFLKLDVHEYKFYKKYENIIKRSNYRKNIQLPIKYKICKDSSIYIFEKIDTNLNSFFLKTLHIPVFNKILQHKFTRTLAFQKFYLAGARRWRFEEHFHKRVTLLWPPFESMVAF